MLITAILMRLKSAPSGSLPSRRRVKTSYRRCPAAQAVQPPDRPSVLHAAQHIVIILVGVIVSGTACDLTTLKLNIRNHLPAQHPPRLPVHINVHLFTTLHMLLDVR